LFREARLLLTFRVHHSYDAASRFAFKGIGGSSSPISTIEIVRKARPGGLLSESATEGRGRLTSSFVCLRQEWGEQWGSRTPPGSPWRGFPAIAPSPAAESGGGGALLQGSPCARRFWSGGTGAGRTGQSLLPARIVPLVLRATPFSQAIARIPLPCRCRSCISTESSVCRLLT
jgi:hypothetical protein